MVSGQDRSNRGLLLAEVRAERNPDEYLNCDVKANINTYFPHISTLLIIFEFRFHHNFIYDDHPCRLPRELLLSLGRLLSAEEGRRSNFFC